MLPVRIHRRRSVFVVLAFLLGTSLAGCGELKKGITFYYAARYGESVELLGGIARKAAKEEPKFSVSLDRNTTLDQAMPALTYEYFEGWQAYVGSLLGLDRVDEACEQLDLALRPVRVKVRRRGTETRSPREGDAWPMAAFALRTWDTQLPCLDR